MPWIEIAAGSVIVAALTAWIWWPEKSLYDGQKAAPDDDGQTGADKRSDLPEPTPLPQKRKPGRPRKPKP